MAASAAQVIALDVGQRRIGVARADTESRFPEAYTTITVDGTEIEQLEHIIGQLAATKVIIGYPRNQRGEPTRQTDEVTTFADRLRAKLAPTVSIAFQDESLTSVLAEDYLKTRKRGYTKADIDAHAAAIILGDYLEAAYAGH